MAFIGFSQVGLKTVAMINREGSKVQREYTETAKKPCILLSNFEKHIHLKVKFKVETLLFMYKM